MVKILLIRSSCVAEIVKKEFRAIFIRGSRSCRERKPWRDGQKIGEEEGGMANNFIKTSLVVALMMGSVSAAGAALANTEVETAELLIKLVQVGRGVISEHQATINDASKGDKGFTGDFIASQVIERFRKATKIDLTRPNSTAQAPLFLALVESEKEVIDEAQPVINKKDVGFKGMIPAVFARKTGERFYRKTGIRGIFIHPQKIGFKMF